MSGIDSPQWELLPQDPEGFFGLEDGFEKKELKRAYNRLIKKFKPEKAPQEFQKIRAAYESLDQQLRYGKRIQQQVQMEAYQWKDISISVESQKVIPLYERLKKESPAAIYKELQSKSDRRPFDYFALALLADTVTKDRLLFVQWLLTGLKDCPGDPGLIALLRQYLDTQIRPEDIPRILLSISKVVNNELFFPLTESCWQRWQVMVPFDKFRALLAKCEANLKLFSGRARVAFYLQILRGAIWKADEVWVENVLQFINSESSEVSSRVEEEIFLVEAIRKYKSNWKGIVKKDPIKGKLHELIQNYFSSPSGDLDQEIIEFQIEMADEPQELLNAFPLRDGEKSDNDIDSMWVLWSHVTEEVMDRNAISPRRVKRDRFMARLFSLMEDLDATWNVTAAHEVMYYGLHVAPYIFIVLLPYLLFGNWIFDRSMFLFVAVPIVLFGIPIYYFVLRRMTVEKMFTRLIQRSIRKEYLSQWRGRFVQLLEATQVTMAELSMGLHEIVFMHDSGLRAATYLVEFVPSDYGVTFYSQAVRFRS